VSAPVFRRILKRWEVAFPEAEVVRLDNASHYLQEDAPEEIVAATAEAFGPGSG
jgi:pimeloyl-ACP methyl ester carboxylesterase